MEEYVYAAKKPGRGRRCLCPGSLTQTIIVSNNGRPGYNLDYPHQPNPWSGNNIFYPNMFSQNYLYPNTLQSNYHNVPPYYGVAPGNLPFYNFP
ncbi:hypothetical protein Phum_PHUM565440 [Pediculus humanus corporis]|uniref:Uncharacterized protein n=1 Tax=Pediculus humanus subsp. corporis TaxID=121224 RepID=E0W0Y4_PEDHC|nr:uncharacterized protein Phum_PHUM565440 [Pediculus humanus corporis]EEB19289.1 hypothetical protein Phum_PHUM565440 [Pediculus humanus corporis]